MVGHKKINLRETIIKVVNSDIYCLCETHLQKDGAIECNGYLSFMNNRKLTDKRARKASGGVAILVKESILSEFDVRIIDKDVEGILGIELNNKSNDFTVVVFACYLPPKNSVWKETQHLFLVI